MNELSVGNIREATASRPTPPSSLAVVPSHLVPDSPSSEDSPESDASSLSPMEWLSPLESPCDLSVISSNHSLTSPGSCIEIPIPGLATPLVSPSVPSSFHSTTSPSTTVSPSGTGPPVHCTRSSPNPKVPTASSGSTDSDSGSGWSTPSPVRSVVSNPSVPCSSQSSPVWSSSSLTSSTSSSSSPPSDVKRYLVATASGRRSSATDLAQTRATRKNLWENIRANPRLNNSKCSSHCRHGKRSPTSDDDDSDFSYSYPASPSSRNSPLYRCPVSSGPLLYGPASPISQGPPYQRDRSSRSPSPMPRSRKRSSRSPVSPSHSPGSPLSCSAVGPVSASPSPVGRHSKHPVSSSPKDTDALFLKSPLNEVAKSRCNSSDTTKGKRRSVSSVVSNVSISSKAFHKKQNGASASQIDGHQSPEIVITADNIDIILSDDYSTMDNIETEHNPSIKKDISSKKSTRHLTDFANTSQNDVSRKSQSNLEGEKIKKLGDRKDDGGKEEAGNETSDKDEKIPTKSRKKKARSNSLAHEQIRASLKQNISSSVHNLSGNHSSASNSISYSIPSSLHTICSGSDSSPKHTNKNGNRAVSRSSSRNASRSVSNSLWDLTTRKPLSHCNSPSPSRASTTNAEKWRRASLGTVGLSLRSRSSTPKDRDGSRRNSVTNTNSGSNWSLWGGGGKSKSITFGPPPPITATVARATPTLSKTSAAASKTGPSISKTPGAIPKTRNASSSISKVGKVVSNAIRVGNTLKKGTQKSPTSTSTELDLPSVSPGQRLSRKVGNRKNGAALDSRMSPDNGAHIRDASRYSPVRDPVNCSHSSRGSTNSLWDSTADNSANVWDSNFSLKDRFRGSTISLKDSSMGSSMSLHDSAMGSSISLRDSIMGSNNSLRHCSIGSSSSLRDSALGSSTSLVYSTLDSIASYKDSTMGSCTSLSDDLKGSSASLIDMPMANSKSLTDSVLDLSKNDVCKTANISDNTIGNGGMSHANIKRDGSRGSTTSLKDSILCAHSSKSMGSTTSLKESTLANTSSVRDVGSITSLKEGEMYYRKDGSFENARKDYRAYSRAKSMTNLRDDSLFNTANSGYVGMADAYVTRQKDVLMGSATNLRDKAANSRLRHGILGSATNLRDSVLTSNKSLRQGVIGSTTNLREKLTSNTTRLRHGVAGSTTDVRDSYLGRNNSIRHSRNGSTTNIRDNAMGSTVSLRHSAISDLIDSAIGLATDTIFNTNLHDTDESSSSEDENANKIYDSLTNKAMEFLTKERVTDLSKSANSLNGTAAYDLLTVSHGKPDLMMNRCRSAHSLTEPQQSYNAADHISRTQSSDLKDLIRKDSQRQKLKRGKSLDLRDLPQMSYSRRVLKRGKSCDLRDLPCTESLDTPGSSEIEDSREFLRMRSWEDREVPKAKSWDGKDASQLHESMVNYINQLEGDLQKCSSMQQCSSPTVSVNYGSDCGSDNRMDRGSGEEESAADNTSSHHEFSQNGDTIRSDTPESNHRRRRRGSADRRSGSGRRQSLDNLNGEELLYALRGRRGSGGSHSHLRGGCAAGGNSWISAIPRHDRKWESLRRGIVDKSIRCSTPKQGRRGSVENICGGMGRKKISSLWDNILGHYVEGELKAKKSLSCSSFKVGGGEEKSEWVTTRDDVDQEEEEEEEGAATTGVLTESGGNNEVVCPQRRAPRFSEIFGGGSIEESRRSRLEVTYGSQDFKDSKKCKRSKDKKRGKMVSSDSDGDFKSASGHSFSRESGLGSSCEEETDYSSGNVTPEGSPSHVGSQKVMAAISHYLRSVDVADSEEDVDSFSKEADHISPDDLMLMSDNEDNFSLSWEDLIISYKSQKYKPNTSKISELENGFENLQMDLENKEASGEVDNPKLDQELDKLLGCDYRQLEGEILSGRSTPARGSKEVVFSSSAKIPSLKPPCTDVKRPWSAEPPRSTEKSHACNESVNNPENHQIDDRTTDEDSKSDSVVTWCSQDKNVSRQSTIVCNEESDELPDAAEDTSKVPRPPTPDSALGSDCTPLSPVSGEETTINDATEEEEDVRTRGRSKEQGPQPGLDGGRDRSVSCSENIKAFLLSQPCAFAHVAGEDCAHEHTDTCGDKHFYPDADKSCVEAYKQAASESKVRRRVRRKKVKKRKENEKEEQKEVQKEANKEVKKEVKREESNGIAEPKPSKMNSIRKFFISVFCTTPVTVEGIAPDQESHGTDPEPLPPPIPPHGIDPATVAGVDVAQAARPLIDPEVMTPEEAQRLLSANIVEGKVREGQTLLSDEEAQEVVLLLSPQEKDAPQAPPPVPPHYSDIPSMVPPHYADVTPPVPPHYGPAEDEYDMRLASRFDPTLTSPLSPEEEPSEADSSEASGDVSQVSRAKEVLVEDGVHYLEDGHFWVEVPGLPEEDEEDELDPTLPFHQHTRLTFSKDPIQVFSTYSVTEYDRKNDEVDPVAASAEYELEKRVEKMDVFPVEIVKGEGGLGLSIIGMGVGADAGVEKLGIFVKTITPGGATERDARIQVNDQIIEVDGKSLVGVTQVFAASVLKNTSGRVHFLIGREKDPENSEVALLIKQSLQADMEREERRRALGGPDYDPHANHGLFDPLSSPSEENSRSEDMSMHHNNYSYMEGGSSPTSPDAVSPPAEVFDLEGDTSDTSPDNDVAMLKLKLKEVQYRNAVAEAEIQKLKMKLLDMEKILEENNHFSSQLRETRNQMSELEEKLQAKTTEVSTYQDMLEQSQGQYIVLEKKYYKAKKIIKEYQGRERDFLHREEYHITQLEDKDSHYNALVKALKDRVISLEAELTNAQKTAGLPVQVPADANTQPAYWQLQQSAQSAKQPPRKPSLCTLDPEISDTETSDTGNSEGDKANTVERKMPVKEELDEAVPPHELLDVSASRAKGELAARGGLANRHLPSLKKTTSMSSAGSQDHSLDDSSLDDDLPESQKHVATEPMQDLQQDLGIRRSADILESPLPPPQSILPPSSMVKSTKTPPPPPPYSHLGSPPPYQHPPGQFSSGRQPLAPSHALPDPPSSLPMRPLGAGMDGQPHHDTQSESRPEIPYRHPPPVARVLPVNRAEISESSSLASHLANRTPQQQSLAEQLKALLAER
ncbi:uncharacterized protein LOC125034296 isoform X1 [Penaeus chinensis]|uniref:uncharacterized protein LOC125034296 isoform X1 n=1 Tax=Penaeus chinensis TaxID=139456 RepID=UPI001FB6B4C9|nr:uncharacterized protein LOC125034296 isoform X1 [Penaeus chinensis]